MPPVTREQLVAAGVGAASLELWDRQQAGTTVRSEVRRIATAPKSSNIGSNIGTGDRRGSAGNATPAPESAGRLHFRLEGRVASAKNSKKRLKLRGRLVDLKSDAAKAFQESAVRQLAPQRPRHHEPIAHPVRVALVLHGPITHPHAVDGDNGLSAVLDALKAAAVLADDAPRIVRASSVEWRPAAAWASEITITPYEGPAA
jgi:Holliday junction resolvase RusA-like endonuclease